MKMNMIGKEIGRNDPCPCGSGKKFKKCCLNRDDTGSQYAYSAGVPKELRQALQGQDFDSMEDLQAFVQQNIQQRNQDSIDEFHGLSPDQMHQLLYHPFTSPRLITFAEPLADTPTAPILTLFELLVEAIGESGLKPTAKGNLPRNFCREAALSYLGEAEYQERTKYGGINKEDDFYELHVTRLVAEMGGLIRKYKGRFILSRDCRDLLTESGLAGIYPRLFKTYVKEFNWGYRDGYPDIDFIQHSFLFTLYLLYLYGDTERPQAFYEDAFIQAFPMLLDEVGESNYSTPEQTLCSCYTLRALRGFAAFFGLAQLEPVMTDAPFVRDYRIVKLPLLNSVVRFHPSDMAKPIQ